MQLDHGGLDQYAYFLVSALQPTAMELEFNVVRACPYTSYSYLCARDEWSDLLARCPPWGGVGQTRDLALPSKVLG